MAATLQRNTVAEMEGVVQRRIADFQGALTAIDFFLSFSIIN
jgi:hypothetical protein